MEFLFKEPLIDHYFCHFETLQYVSIIVGALEQADDDRSL